jgi:hypothetical protein
MVEASKHDPNGGKPNILLFVVDSVSRSTAMQTLPKTIKYLRARFYNKSIK